MLLLKAVGISSSGLKTIAFHAAGEWRAQGCLCRACCSEERIRSRRWARPLRMMETATRRSPGTGPGQESEPETLQCFAN